MLFRIDGPPAGGEIPEYGLIELQGRIEQQHDVPPGEPLPVGTVVLSKTVRCLRGERGLLSPGARHHSRSLSPARPNQSTQQQPQQQHPDVVKITIGYHEIEGKRIALKRPLAILERRPSAEAAATTDEQGFAVVGVVRHRFLFKGRPRALITKPGEARGQTMASKNRQQQREEAAAADGGGGEPVVAG
jgi:hypothetical protein